MYNMNGSGADIPDNVERETLERLYDDPEERVAELLEYRPDDDQIENTRQVFQALANDDRLRLMESLRHGERCGCELMVILDAPQSTVATHLRKLRKAGLVKNRKKGKWNYYRIADPAIMEILDLTNSVGNG
jgi:ArsR family transcriptional regulator